MLGPDRRIVETRGNGICVESLAFGCFQQIAFCTLEHAQLACTARETNGVPAGFRAIAAGLVAVQVHTIVIEEGVHDADGVRTTTYAGADRIRMIDAVPILQTVLGLFLR